MRGGLPRYTVYRGLGQWVVSVVDKPLCPAIVQEHCAGYTIFVPSNVACIWYKLSWRHDGHILLVV